MADGSDRRLPQGVDVLLGGTAIAVCIAVLALFAGAFDIAGGGAPPVRIDPPVRLVSN